MKKAFLALVAWPVIASANPWWLNGSNANQTDFLPPDAAFRVSSVIDGDLIRVRWVVADGYYLYRSKFDISAESPDLSIEPPVFPKGLPRTDAYFGAQEIYQRYVEAVAGFRRADAGAHPVQIRVTYQGCAEAGLCYPPIVKVLNPEPLPQPAGAATAAPQIEATAPQIYAAAPRTDSAPVAVAILGGVLAFFIAGWNRRRKNDPAAL